MSEQHTRDRLVGGWRLLDYSVTAAERDKTDRPLGDHPLATIRRRADHDNDYLVPASRHGRT